MSVIIRKAELQDKDSVNLLIAQFYNEYYYDHPFTFDWSSIAEDTTNFINLGVSLIAQESNELVGCIGGMLCPTYFNHTQLCLEELLWYVTKQKRKGLTAIRLLKKFEEEGKRNGAQFVKMSHMAGFYDDKLPSLYNKRGYKPFEFYYLKEV